WICEYTRQYCWRFVYFEGLDTRHNYSENRDRCNYELSSLLDDDVNLPNVSKSEYEIDTKFISKDVRTLSHAIEYLKLGYDDVFMQSSKIEKRFEDDVRQCVNRD